MFDLYIEHKTLRRFHLREQAHVVFPRRTYNEPAKHLYRKIGFTDSYRYWFRVRNLE